MRAEMRRDYSARELAVAQGDPLRVVEVFDGWVRVRNTFGVHGWVPATHVEPQRGAK